MLQLILSIPYPFFKDLHCHFFYILGHPANQSFHELCFVTKMKHSWHSKDFDRISLTLNNSPTTCACGSQAVCRVDLVSSPGARDVAVATLFLLLKIRPWWSCPRPKMCFLFSASCLTQSCRTVVLLTQLLPTACFIVLFWDERAVLRCELSNEKSYERSIEFFWQKRRGSKLSVSDTGFYLPVLE